MKDNKKSEFCLIKSCFDYILIQLESDHKSITCFHTLQPNFILLPHCMELPAFFVEQKGPILTMIFFSDHRPHTEKFKLHSTSIGLPILLEGKPGVSKNF